MEYTEVEAGYAFLKLKKLKLYNIMKEMWGPIDIEGLDKVPTKVEAVYKTEGKIGSIAGYNFYLLDTDIRIPTVSAVKEDGYLADAEDIYMIYDEEDPIVFGFIPNENEAEVASQAEAYSYYALYEQEMEILGLLWNQAKNNHNISLQKHEKHL